MPSLNDIGRGRPAPGQQGLSLSDMGQMARAPQGNPLAAALQAYGIDPGTPGVAEAMQMAQRGDIQGALAMLAQSDAGSTDAGAQLIEQLSQQLGVSSPFGSAQSGQGRGY